ncbi:MAG: hypothetical protein AAFY70_04550, partial [Bacteroidota bacterium]
QKQRKFLKNYFLIFMSVDYGSPSAFVEKLWEKYESPADKNANLNGKMFESILAAVCIREGILPLFMSAKVAFVPNVIYDLMFYTPKEDPYVGV